MVTFFKEILNFIVAFFKKLFEKNINIHVENNNKYNVKKNKNCNISINDSGDNNDKR